MRATPPYLSDLLMPLFKTALVFAFMLGVASVIAGLGFCVFTFITTDLSITTVLFSGFMVFLKGAALTASISFISFIAFWKKHQIKYNNCKYSQSTNCDKIGLYRFA